MSDLTLYPIRGQVAQVNGKNEYIIYVPRADKYTYGTVKIGDGLNVVDGVISVDAENAATIKTIAKNGTDLVPDMNKRVNIELTKADVGLNNVNNTSDLDKPISTATQQAIDEVKSSVSTTQNNLDDYKLVVNNKFEEQKSDVDGRLLVINNTISQNKTATDSAIQRIEEVLEGKEQAVAFTNYQAVVNDFNNAATNKYNVGQSIYVQSVNVPDLWVYSVENTHVDFAYVGDEDIIESLETTGTVQFGYYKLAMMETKTASVANAVTLDTNQTITGVKSFDIDDSFAKFDAEYVTLQHKNGSRLSAIYVGDKLELGSVGTDGTTFKGITHDPSTYITNITGVLQYGGSDVLTKTSIVDSDSILVSEDSLGKLKLELNNEITNKIQKTLVVPMSAPSTTELVAVDDGNSQTMIEIGEGLLLENGVLKSTGGSSGESSGIVLLKEDFSTIEGLYNKIAELYSSNKDFIVSMTPTSSLSGRFYTMQITSTTHAPTDAGNTGTIMSANRTYRFRLVEKGSDYFMLAGVNDVNLTLKVYSWNNINATLKGLNSGSASEFIFNVISSSISTSTAFAKLATSVYYYETESSEAVQQILNTEV